MIGGCACGLAAALLPEGALGRTTSRGLACGLEPGEANAKLAAGLIRGLAGAAAGQSDLASGSGDSAFDQALGLALIDVSRAFSVFPTFVYYDDATSGKNALATDEKLRGFERKSDGTVLFGLGLLGELRRLKGGDAAVLAICAHEFGHIHAFQSGVFDQIDRLYLHQYTKELHADFLAGYFIGEYVSKYPALDVFGVAQQWSRMGATDFNRPGSHGTAWMRRDALEAGFYFAADRRARSIRDASAAGLDHIKRYEIE